MKNYQYWLMAAGVATLSACSPKTDNNTDNNASSNTQSTQPSDSKPHSADFRPSEHRRVPTPTSDLHSFANSNQVRAPHLHLNLDVDFDAQQLRGYAQYELEYIDASANYMVLDTYDLDIQQVEIFANDSWQEGSFRLGDKDPVLGQALTISIVFEDNVQGDSEQATRAEQVRIHYASSPTATGLDWVSPEGTAGGEHPYLYSQSQPHYARTWVPIQDTAASRLTFSARLTTPPELIGLMGANNPPHSS